MQRHRGTTRTAQAGALLPLVLVLLGLCTLLATQALRTAAAEAGLVRALSAAQEAAALARAQSSGALAAAGRDPGRLPPPLAGARAEASARVTGAGSARADWLFVASDAVCPALGASIVTREHYEIVATAETSTGAVHTEHLGFYVCREVCNAPCTAATTGPVMSYWRTGRAAP